MSKAYKIGISLVFLKGQIRKELKTLCYKEGVMKFVLAKDLPAYGKVAIAKNRYKKIIGWAVVSRAKGKFGTNPIIMVYIYPSYRGKGIAKKLVKKTLKEFKSLYKKRKNQRSYYNIPSERKKVIYFDRLANLFEGVIKRNGFKPKLLHSW